MYIYIKHPGLCGSVFGTGGSLRRRHHPPQIPFQTVPAGRTGARRDVRVLGQPEQARRRLQRRPPVAARRHRPEAAGPGPRRLLRRHGGRLRQPRGFGVHGSHQRVLRQHRGSWLGAAGCLPASALWADHDRHYLGDGGPRRPSLGHHANQLQAAGS